MIKKILLISMMILGLTPMNANAETSEEVLGLIVKANDYWQEHNSPYVRGFWDNAAYFTGNMEAYRLTGKAEYYQFSDKWCRHCEWKGAKSNDKKNWKYAWYGEGDDFVLFGDWQICFQTYIDMYNLVPAEYKVARAKEVMGYECDIEDNKFWWWADALYMVMPVMTKMYKLTGEERYLDKLYQNFLWSDSLMWDAEAQLYYRDGKYIWPKVKTSCDGGKSFWARGDGWVLAGLAKVLADMPKDYKGYPFFVKRFQQLAEGVARCQQADGYWSRSMLCEGDAPGPETSGTAFFCYGFEWGVNNGLLDAEKYKGTIESAWNYLKNTALQADGSIGYVQPIGEKPDPTKIVDSHSQAPFGTGAWLLAACERVRYLDAKANGKMEVKVSNATNLNRQDVIELDAKQVYQKLGIGGGRQFIVKNADNVEIPYQITSDGKVLIQAFVRPMASTTYTVSVGKPKDYRLDCNGRIYPNREEDLAWENDKNAWRLYGPKMVGKGVNGYDVFTKNVTYPIQDVLYQSELTSYGINEKLKKAGRGGEWNEVHKGYTYHRDHGQGMDAYTVGSTLGAGASALIVDGKMQLSDAFSKAEIMDNGPLRFTVKLTIGDKETRILSQDRGTHLAKASVTFTDAPEKAQIAAGIIIHKDNEKGTGINKKDGYITYADNILSPETQNGQLYIACLFPDKATLKVQDSHILGIQNYKANDTFTYYFGTAWSKNDVPTMQVWDTLMQGYSQQLKNPLKVEY